MGAKKIQIVNVETALDLFYSKTEIGTADIKKLFGISSSTVVCRLKKSAREVMEEKETSCWNTNCVDTECAFEAWKIDIPRLEKMFKKKKSLGLMK